MLTIDELRRVSAQFGADERQVRRDHLASHFLAAIARLLALICPTAGCPRMWILWRSVVDMQRPSG